MDLGWTGEILRGDQMGVIGTGWKRKLGFYSGKGRCRIILT